MSTRKIRELVEAYRRVSPSHKNGAEALALDALAEVEAIERACIAVTNGPGRYGLNERAEAFAAGVAVLAEVAKDAP